MTATFSLNPFTEVSKALSSHAAQHPTKFFLCSAMVGAGFAIIVVPRALGFGKVGPRRGELRNSNIAQVVMMLTDYPR